MTEQTYVVLLGDLVASRDRPDRAAEQDRLLAAVLEGNDRVTWAAPLTVTAGDEVQGLLVASDAEWALETMTLLSEALVDLQAPSRAVVGHHIRFGLGSGALTTDAATAKELASTSPALLDGPCFHRARTALESARASQRWACVRGYGTDPDEAEARAIDSLLALMGVVRGNWTSTQVRYVLNYREEVRRRIRESVEAQREGRPSVLWGIRRHVAESEGRSPSVITQAFQAAALDEILDGEEAVRKLLRRWSRESAESRSAGSAGGSAP